MNPKRTLVALLVLSAAASAQTVTVTTSADVTDIDYFTGTVADLPGPDGKVSFLEAIVATNHTPGHQTIAFNIPQSEWGLQFLYPGCAVIMSGPNGFNATDSVTIDGTTQTAFTGDTNPNGQEVAIYFSFGTLGAGLGGDGSVLRGLHAGEWSVWGDNSHVTGNSGGMHINVSGDSNVVEGNEAGTIKIDGGSNNLVVGNTMQRVRIWGGSGNRVGGPTPAERNHITGYGWTNSEGLPSGTDVELFQTQDTVIENNYIGTTPDGMAQGNQFSNMGIEVDTGNVGLRVRDNLIGGVLGHGQGPHWAGTVWGWAIYFQGSGSDVEFSGNTIGLDAAGNATLPSVWGVHTASSTYSDVRFVDNVIAGHYFNGVTVGKDTPSLRLSGNRIFGNAWSWSEFLGIDLIGSSSATGLTPNDPLDGDVGGNGLQNFPVLASAVMEASTTRVTGSLDSAPGSSYTLEFFATPGCDPNGHGQGQEVLGTLSVATDAAGHADFSGSVLATQVGWVVTATATLEPVGATSEFSACLPVAAPFCQPDLGYGGPGSALLTVCGEVLTAGAFAELAVQGTPALAPLWIVFGVVNNPMPLFAGTLVPFPPLLVQPLPADGAGEAQLTIPGGAAAPVDVFAQGIFIDGSLPGVVGFTNAVAIQLLR